jgi:hypothetical protein
MLLDTNMATVRNVSDLQSAEHDPDFSVSTSPGISNLTFVCTRLPLRSSHVSSALWGFARFSSVSPSLTPKPLPYQSLLINNSAFIPAAMLCSNHRILHTMCTAHTSLLNSQQSSTDTNCRYGKGKGNTIPVKALRAPRRCGYQNF